MLIEQAAASAPPSVQVYPAGRLSVSVTPVAVPGPRLLDDDREDRRVAGLDRAAVGGLDDLDVGALDGDRGARVRPAPSLVEPMWPVLSMTPQLADVVADVSVTVPLTAVLPGIVPTLQVSTLRQAGRAGAGEAADAPRRPFVVGRSSVTTTPLAGPDRCCPTRA